MVKKTKKIKAKIKVVGLGSAGCAVINQLMKAKIPKIEFIAINTDRQSLTNISAHRKVRIGKRVAKGLGVGMNIDLGQKAAEESQKEIKEVLRGAEVIFFVVGLGGGTGSGAFPIILDLIKDYNILTIALVTKPFAFEGSKKLEVADQCLARLTSRVDTLICLSNENILQLIDRKTSLVEAFRAVDRVLVQTIQSITEIINFSGLVNLDLADLKAVLSKSGRALLGIGEAEGENRALRAIKSAIESQLLDLSFKNARGIIFIISGGENLNIHEINEAAKFMISSVDAGCRVVFGVSVNAQLANKIKITVIAAGLNVSSNVKIESKNFIRPQLESNSVETSISINQNNQEENFQQEEKFRDGHLVPEPTDELEIPAFLRKKRGN